MAQAIPVDAGHLGFPYPAAARANIPLANRVLDGAIGRTPLMEISFQFRGEVRTVFAKAEFLNLTGSIKDRMAWLILNKAREAAALRPGQEIAEVSSGNAGIALAAVGAALGHPVTIFMPDWMSEERRGLLRSYGAQLKLVSREEGGFVAALRQCADWVRSEGAFPVRQFANADNVVAHADGTAAELALQLAQAGRTLDGFVAGVGTGGTVMGVARHFAQHGGVVRVHPVEPAESPTLTTGHKVGHHRIQGISDEFIPEIVRLEELGAPIAVSDNCAIRMTQRLCRELGLGVGISSGANLLAAIALQDELPTGATVATVFCDNSLRYLSTDLCRDEPARGDSIVPEIEFRDLRIMRYGQLPQIPAEAYRRAGLAVAVAEAEVTW